MEGWDQETLERVVKEKHGAEEGRQANNPTNIICKHFLVSQPVSGRVAAGGSVTVRGFLSGVLLISLIRESPAHAEPGCSTSTRWLLAYMPSASHVLMLHNPVCSQTPSVLATVPPAGGS
jgi:hypothetical protein